MIAMALCIMAGVGSEVYILLLEYFKRPKFSKREEQDKLPKHDLTNGPALLV